MNSLWCQNQAQKVGNLPYHDSFQSWRMTTNSPAVIHSTVCDKGTASEWQTVCYKGLQAEDDITCRHWKTTTEGEKEGALVGRPWLCKTKAGPVTMAWYIVPSPVKPHSAGHPPESIQSFIDGLALFDAAPRPPPPPFPVSNMSLFLSLPVCRRSSLLNGEWAWVGVEPNHTTAKKPGPLKIIQYSLSPSV